MLFHRRAPAGPAAPQGHGSHRHAITRRAICREVELGGCQSSARKSEKPHINAEAPVGPSLERGRLAQRGQTYLLALADLPDLPGEPFVPALAFEL